MMLLMNNKTCTIHSEMMKNDTLQLAWVSMISLTRKMERGYGYRCDSGDCSNTAIWNKKIHVDSFHSGNNFENNR